MFGRKKVKEPTLKYNPDTMRPVMRCSICTGEKAVGFKDKATGRFTEVFLVRSDKDLQEFMSMYNLDYVDKEY